MPLFLFIFPILPSRESKFYYPFKNFTIPLNQVNVNIQKKPGPLLIIQYSLFNDGWKGKPPISVEVW
jgi:hypothetical protein